MGVGVVGKETQGPIVLLIDSRVGLPGHLSRRRTPLAELRRRMAQDIELRSLKENTLKACVDASRHPTGHSIKSPDLLSEEEVRRHFVWSITCCSRFIHYRWAR
jgi:hypothetical protein